MVVKNKAVWSKVKPLAKDLKSDDIYSKEEFHEVLKYERIRADRSDSIFSIVLFKPPEIYFNKKNHKKFITEIIRQARLIDHIGWYDDEYVAALLPETGKTGAEMFSRKILNEIEYLDAKNTAIEIYTYPDSWLDKVEKSISARSEDNRARSLDFSACVEDSFTNGIPVWKRIMDMVLSAAGLIIISPVFLFFYLYLKVISPGPTLFSQTRVGYKGKEFKFWKFRTMHHGNSAAEHGKYLQDTIKDGDAPMIKLDAHDPRIIFGGRVFRKACIDELPQLINVLKGEMSLVGPRPCIPYEAEEYLRWHTHRFDVVPGMTGLWQVSGKNKLSFKQMIRLDIIYSNNISFYNDLLIIIKTPKAILDMLMESVAKKVGMNSSSSIGDTSGCVSVDC